MNDKFHNRVGGDRISSRQIDELIGLARGLAADGTINKAEIEFLQKWLAQMRRSAASHSSEPCISGSMIFSPTVCSTLMNTPNSWTR
ncbi:hypothetical protein [Mesorhizobium sp. M1342]|uniref:hypothetical protein n=1 Tax=Mesorhizobium sp. M1342 TaxID=2957088 RepID=UPI00333AB68B